ncbi:MAG: sugar phosphate nucleotidyltransferase [Ignavibacteria bacterium]|nr:sugar phosphate nucleotidyltransferase [Ignavibacteria bacterium]
MKAVIPVAGEGTRLRPHTLTKPKVLMNIAGKPMIHYIVEQLINDNLVSEIILITGAMSEMIEKYLRKEFNFKFTFIKQEKPLGLGHAVFCAKTAFRDESILIILGDTLFDIPLKEMISNNYSVIGVKPVEDPRRFGVVETDNNGFIIKFVEKPASPEVSPSNNAIVGIYKINNSKLLFESLEYIIERNIKTSNEYQLTDALSEYLSKGEKMITFKVDNWLDCGNKESVLQTNAYLLRKMNLAYKIKGSLIKDYCYIGKDVKIHNSIIGEYVSISDNCIIENSIIENSILEKNCKIENSILKDSLIGEYAKIRGQKNEYNIGDYSEI